MIFVSFVHVCCYETAAAGHVPEGYGKVLSNHAVHTVGIAWCILDFDVSWDPLVAVTKAYTSIIVRKFRSEGAEKADQ